MVRTKVRTRLGYEKLHKLVFVHYNLKLRLQQFESDIAEVQEEDDPFALLMDVTLHDEGNPILEWLSNARSEAAPEIDVDEIAEEIERFEPGHPFPTNVVIDVVRIDMSGERLLDEPINTWATKRKHPGDGPKSRKRKGKSMAVEEDEFASGDDTDNEIDGSPVYAESGDSSSSDNDHDHDGDVNPDQRDLQAMKSTGAF